MFYHSTFGRLPAWHHKDTITTQHKLDVSRQIIIITTITADNVSRRIDVRANNRKSQIPQNSRHHPSAGNVAFLQNRVWVAQFPRQVNHNIASGHRTPPSIKREESVMNLRNTVSGKSDFHNPEADHRSNVLTPHIRSLVLGSADLERMHVPIEEIFTLVVMPHQNNGWFVTAAPRLNHFLNLIGKGVSRAFAWMYQPQNGFSPTLTSQNHILLVWPQINHVRPFFGNHLAWVNAAPLIERIIMIPADEIGIKPFNTGIILHTISDLSVSTMHSDFVFLTTINLFPVKQVSRMIDPLHLFGSKHPISVTKHRQVAIQRTQVSVSNNSNLDVHSVKHMCSRFSWHLQLFQLSTQKFVLLLENFQLFGSFHGAPPSILNCQTTRFLLVHVNLYLAHTAPFYMEVRLSL